MRYLLLFLLGTLSIYTFAARPVRHILTKDAEGRTIVVPYKATQHTEPSIPTCFPSSLHQHPTRAFSTFDADGLGRYGESAMGVLRSIGEPTIPVVMVEFDDVAFQPTTTPELVNRYFNEKGFNSNQGWGGSVRDYFVDQSYGLFSPKFQIVGKVKLPKSRAYYGHNSGSSVHVNVDEFYQNAVRQALQLRVSFKTFETEHQNIPLVILYFAGASENSSLESGSEDYLWSAFKESPYEIDGHSFQSYLVVGELINHYKSENGELLRDVRKNPIVDHAELEGPGVKCHEICHALGLPDAYDTQNKYLDTPDYLDLMDYGQYVTTMGERPMGLSAYQRNCLGWLRISTLEDVAGYYQLLPLHNNLLGITSDKEAQAYLLRNPQNPKEFYVLENRQASTWFPKSLGMGMLVYHVDYDASLWNSNRVNVQENQQCYEIVPADGKRQTHNQGTKNDFAGDFFPGFKNVTTWSSTSSPAIAWKNGPDNRALYGITIKEPTLNIGFALNDETLVGIVNMNEKRLWNSSNDCYYDLQGKQQTQPKEGCIYVHQGQKVIFYSH